MLALYLPFDPGASADITPFLAALGLGVALTLGYLFFSIGMRRGVPPVTAAIVSNIEPILNPTWCFLFLGEFPGVLSIIGALIVLTAVTAYTILSPAAQDARIAPRQSAAPPIRKGGGEGGAFFMRPCISAVKKYLRSARTLSAPETSWRVIVKSRKELPPVEHCGRRGGRPALRS